MQVNIPHIFSLGLTYPAKVNFIKVVWLLDIMYQNIQANTEIHVIRLKLRFILCLCVCVCLSVITFVARWLDLVTWCQVRPILSTRTRKCNTSQNDPFPDPDHMDYLDHITLWPITSKLMNGFTPNFNSI